MYKNIETINILMSLLNLFFYILIYSNQIEMERKFVQRENREVFQFMLIDFCVGQYYFRIISC